MRVKCLVFRLCSYEIFVHEFHVLRFAIYIFELLICKWDLCMSFIVSELNDIYIYIYIYVQLLIFMYNCWYIYIYIYIWRVLTFNDWSTSSQKKKKKTLARLVHIMNITKTLVSRDYLIRDNNLIGLKRKRTTIWLDFGKCIILLSKKKKSIKYIWIGNLV